MKTTLKTTFLGVRKPKRIEKEDQGADLVFLREDQNGNEILIYVATPTGESSWFQWGQTDEILFENVSDVDDYFNKI